MPLALSVVQAQVDGKTQMLLVIDPKEGKGIEPERIIGSLASKNDHPDWSTFRRNATFVDFVVRYFKGELGSAPKGIEAARVDPGERFFVIDGRTEDPGGEVPPHDIVGAYETDADGRPILESFVMNANHQLVTPDGPTSSLLANDDLVSRLPS